MVKENVVAFLDAYFKKGDIDQEGGVDAAQYTREDWMVIFNKYEEHVRRLEQFHSIRYVIVIS